MDECALKNIISIAKSFTWAWVVAAPILILFWPHEETLKINEFGDFLAGAFAPLAFAWLVLGYFLQSQELRLQRKELALQREQLEQQKEEVTRLANYSETSNRMARILEQPEIRFEGQNILTTPTHRSEFTANFDLYFEGIGRDFESYIDGSDRQVELTHPSTDRHQILIQFGMDDVNELRHGSVLCIAYYDRFDLRTVQRFVVRGTRVGRRDHFPIFVYDGNPKFVLFNQYQVATATMRRFGATFAIQSQ